MNIIFLPGLGFDHRIFQNIKPPNSSIKYMDWVEPQRGENIKEYAFRFSEKINEGSILIGHSFGGILALEIARIKKIKKVILISSIRSRKELPVFFKTIGWLRLHIFFNKKTTFSTFPFWAKKHGYDTAEKQALFKNMVGGYSDSYLQWALKKLSMWKGSEEVSAQVVQIHGTGDLTFLLKYISRPDYILKNGTHIMVFDRAGEISEILDKEIN